MEFDETKIDQLVEEYEKALLAELREATELDRLKVKLEYAERQAISGAVIDGKNADARKAQRDAILDADGRCQPIRQSILEQESSASLASIRAKCIYRKCKLIEASLAGGR